MATHASKLHTCLLSRGWAAAAAAGGRRGTGTRSAPAAPSPAKPHAPEPPPPPAGAAVPRQLRPAALPQLHPAQLQQWPQRLRPAPHHYGNPTWVDSCPLKCYVNVPFTSECRNLGSSLRSSLTRRHKAMMKRVSQIVSETNGLKHIDRFQ